MNDKNIEFTGPAKIYISSVHENLLESMVKHLLVDGQMQLEGNLCELIRIEDLANPQVLREKLQLNLEIKNLVLSKVYGETPVSFD
ncbi:hypothetical protein, partial [Acetomicrobium sp. S15 = DSM 107314]|uniref:hypothetical protein n=1 Tax=Acetomicrobium sp. S15 = DSM 107314 TaxID=2529858 RepID=UPI001E3A034B